MVVDLICWNNMPAVGNQGVMHHGFILIRSPPVVPVQE